MQRSARDSDLVYRKMARSLARLAIDAAESLIEEITGIP